MTAKLIIPLIGTGNVPQLSIDLLLHSTNSFNYVKRIDSKFVYPFSGPLDHAAGEDPKLYNGKTLFSSAIELFKQKDEQIYVIQQRTPIIPGYLNNFIVETLIPVLHEYQITELIVLDSFGALDGVVESLNGSGSFFNVGTCNLSSVNDLIQQFDDHLNLRNNGQVNRVKAFNFDDKGIQQDITTEQDIFKVVYHLTNTSNLQLNKIKYYSTFVHEGDNSKDAYTFYNNLMLAQPEVFPRIDEFHPPVSWKGVYGFTPIRSAYDEGLYT